MTQRIDPIRRRGTAGPKRRETIEELYGDVLAPAPIGLFDPDEPEPETPRHRDATFSELAEDGPKPPNRAYRPAAEGAPGSFKRSGKLEFPRNGGDLTPIVLSHGLVTLFSLGIWRFWQLTAQRKSVWSHTKLAGEPFEYRGSGLEMFIGAAVMAVVLAAILLGVQMALGWFGLGAFVEDAGAGALMGAGLAFAPALLLLPLIEYARYRARRYRLRRTRWRGIRFDMRGAGSALVTRWAIWAPVVIATLGLALPFLITARERYMTNNTFWGDEPFFFKGSAWRLMGPWVFLWLLLAVPTVIGAAHVWEAVESAALAEELFPDPFDTPVDSTPPPPLRTVPINGETPVQRIDVPPPQLAPPVAPEIIAPDPVRAALLPLRDAVISMSGVLTGAGAQMQTLILLGWVAVLAFGWFGYRAARIRVFMNARRIAEARARCTFRGNALFSAWLATIGRSIWPGILVFMLIGVVIFILMASIENDSDAAAGAWGMVFGGLGDWRAQGLAIMALAVNYGSSMLFGMWLTDVVWFRAFFHSLCATTEIEGLESLEHVRQRAHAGAAEADGLADAFDIEVGF
jgi:hypothetical protein